MELSLPARLFLLAYDPKKRRLTNRTHLGVLLRSAALTELVFDGQLTDADGRVVAGGATSDPVLSPVLADVAAGTRPRKWQSWVDRRTSATIAAVREQLAASHVIRAERRKVLGLFPVWSIELRDTRLRSKLAENARRTLRGGEPVERVDRRDAAVVALAAAGLLGNVVSRGDRRQYKRRIDALSEQVGPTVRALRKAVQSQQAAAASG
ncbi:GOLPH3/VPS74 family protein [Cryptosporangium phraense]|uniref:GPP34 family phosphoprotein n=1 Tax=Cryptosporangium phraense TaxID=2593070 RepID=A0A545AJI1_9ACTN|nr:GPP34 family phosphoprotein [Cryptosporangium phraense]TQS40855.1 GPP34 family phosphoprotein [Cryptosporangium phraense]